MADELDEAKLEAEGLLSQHASGYAAHIFEDDEQVASIQRDERACRVCSMEQPST